MVVERTPHLEMDGASVAFPVRESEGWVTCNDFAVLERRAWKFAGNVEVGDVGGSLSPMPLESPFGLQEIDCTGCQPAAITDEALLQLLSEKESVNGGDTVSGNGESGFPKETYEALNTYDAFKCPEQFELEGRSRQTQTPAGIPPASDSGRLLAPRHSNPSLSRLPLELLRFIVDDLDGLSQMCLKFTNSYFHSIIEHKCIGRPRFRRRQRLISCLERDVGTYRALLQCSNCKEFRLRMLVPGLAPNRRWTPSRLSFREELRSCCKTLVPPGTTAVRLSQAGASVQELKAAECVIDVGKPGVALILVCLHCSGEMVYTGEDVDKQRCTLCGCGFCPLVFMPRKLAVSLVDV